MDGSTLLPQPRSWRAGPIGYDERNEVLTINGQVTPIEPIPRRLLHRLLRASGETVAKEALIATGWRSTRALSDASFYNAMKRLRATLSEAGPDLILLETGRGYRLSVPVTAESSPAPVRPVLSLSPGELVPGRARWRLSEALDHGGRRDVWLAVHDDTAERRVFKFAEDPERRAGLREEMLCARRLREMAANQDGFVGVLECALEGQPAYIESEYGGRDLAAWADSRGGLASVAYETRVQIIASAAAILAAAHEVGVLHGGLAPGNILVDDEPQPLRIRVIAFKAGGIAAPSLPMSHPVWRSSGAPPYVAPEALNEGQPSLAADIYALGILLYQIIAGDLSRPLTAGWELDIADPLLREDIAEAAAGDPQRRISSARLLAERLGSLPARQLAREALHREQKAAWLLYEAAEARRRRRPWMAAAAAALILGITTTSAALLRATRERGEALRQAAIAGSVSQFLTDDLLGRGNPAISGDPKETLMAAAQAAEPMIDQRVGRQPMLAGALYLALAGAFDGRRETGPARGAYQRSITAYRQAEGPNGADVVIVTLRRAILEVKAVQPGSLEVARQLIASSEKQVAALGSRRAEATAWFLAARATAQIGGGNMELALADYTKASTIAESLPTAFNPAIRFWLRDRQGFSLTKLGRWTEAGAIYARLAREQAALHGATHPNTLEAQLHVAMVDAFSDQPAAALSRIDQIYPAMETVYGLTNKNTLLALNVRSTALMALGRYNEAARDDMTVHDRAAATQGPDSFYAFSTLGHAGDMECRAGQTAPGTLKVEQALAISDKALGRDSAVSQSGRVTLAACRVLAGRGSEALPLMNGIDCKSLGVFLATPGLCQDMTLLRGVAEVQGGKPELGAALLQATLALNSKPLGDPFFAELARHTLSQLGKP